MNHFIKVSKYFFIALFAMLFLNSCSPDGKDGKVYLAIYDPSIYCYYFTSYTDNNPGIPYNFYQGSYYLCSPGTYSYDYYVSSNCGYDSYHCWGSYTMIENLGTPAGFLTAGVDGADKYYNLFCEWSGASSKAYRLAKPITFDTTYKTNRGSLRVTGTIEFGVKPPQNKSSKIKAK